MASSEETATVLKPFSITIDATKLVRGLRPSKRVPRNSGYLVECKNAVGRDGTLQVLDALTRIDTSAIATTFPYPQIFALVNRIIVCNQTAIYEWSGSALTAMITGLTAGSVWTVVDFYDYLYFSNGTVVVVRKSTDGTYALDTTLPKAEVLLDVHGQVMAGGLLT